MRGSKLHKALSISAIIVMIIILHIVGFLRPVEELLRRIILPGSDALYSWSITLGDEIETFESVESLEQAYTELHTKYVEEQRKSALAFLLQEENTQLREQLSFFSSSTYPHIGADVVGKNIEPLGSTLIINIGENHGVLIGNPVIVRNGILIGTVIRVNKTTALVRLLNDNQSKIAATITNRDKSIGIIEGGYGISIRMNFIPQNEELFVGDTVVTSGLSETIPKGLFIGTIESIEKEAYQPFQEAVITPAVQLNKIDIVSVILTPTPTP